jgi:hypothetical protein
VRAFVFCDIATLFGSLPGNAQTKVEATAINEDIVIVAKRLEQVENPAVLENFCKNLDTAQGKKVADTLTTYFYNCKDCGTKAIENVDADVGHTKDTDIEHSGYIQSPVNYTVCHAYAEDTSVSCNGTFTGSYRTADDRGSQTSNGRIDGLHWYIVVPKPAGLFPGGCSVKGTVLGVVREGDEAIPGAVCLQMWSNRHNRVSLRQMIGSHHITPHFRTALRGGSLLVLEYVIMSFLMRNIPASRTGKGNDRNMPTPAMRGTAKAFPD